MNFLRKIYYRLPPNYRFLARRLYYFPVDVIEGISGKRDGMTPPRGMIYTGSGDFKQQGQQMLTYFRELGGLEPHHHFLDIGSGIGRIAVPLTDFLNENGSYEGFDVVKKGVDWCQTNISSRFSNFNFRFIPLDNDLYRSGGARASSFEFPYSDEQFDFVALISVFTHMVPEEVANYLREIHRVLKPGGTCFATFFIWNKEARQLSSQREVFQFPYDYGHYRLMDDKVRSANVAFEEKNLKQKLIQAAGLNLESTYYGFWCGRPKEDCKDFQDIVIMRK